MKWSMSCKISHLFSLFCKIVNSLWFFLILGCDVKAEDAVDYEDIDEEYDGPETEAANEEDYLLPKKEFFSAEASVCLESKASVFDDENYDEESEKEQDFVNDDCKVDNIPLAGNIFLHELHHFVIAVVLCFVCF